MTTTPTPLDIPPDDWVVMTRLHELDPDWLVREDLVAALLRVSKETLGKDRRAGRPPPAQKRLGGRSPVLYRVGDLRDYLASIGRGSTVPPSSSTRPPAKTSPSLPTRVVAPTGHLYNADWMASFGVDRRLFVLEGPSQRPIDFIYALGLEEPVPDDHPRTVAWLTREEFGKRLAGILPPAE